MAKSIRSKREKRLRAIRRELVEPYYEKKDAAKQAALEAALAAPKLPPKPYSSSSPFSAMETATVNDLTSSVVEGEDVMMRDETDKSKKNKALKPVGKKLKKKLKFGKKKRGGGGKGKIKKRRI